MKTWLVTQNPSVAEATKQVLNVTDINITSDGRHHFGLPLGTQKYTNQFIAKKVEQWCTELRSLSNIVESQQHAAYAALTHGLSSRWYYMSQTTPHISRHLKNLKSTLRLELIPRFIGRPLPYDDESVLFSLPARLEVLGLRNPGESADKDFQS